MRILPFLFGIAGIAAAERDAFASELVYDAPAECPSRDEVIAKLRADRESSRPARVTVRRREPKGFVADVTVGSGDDSTSRRIEGETCEGVVEAVRLVLSLDQPNERESADVHAPPPPALAPAQVIEPADSPASAEAEERSAVEIALGQETGARSLAAKTLWSVSVFVELGLPTMGPSWYRPSARAAVDGASTSLFFSRFGSTKTSFLGGMLDVCPIGAAVASTTHLEMVLAACGRAHLGEAERTQSTFWSDAGGVARAEVQIGRKRHVRGLISMSGGMLWRLAGDVGVPQTVTAESDTTTRVFLVPKNMWTFSVGGGVLFR